MVIMVELLGMFAAGEPVWQQPSCVVLLRREECDLSPAEAAGSVRASHSHTHDGGGRQRLTPSQSFDKSLHTTTDTPRCG